MSFMEDMEDIGMRVAYHHYLNDWRNQTISYEEFCRKAAPRPVATNPRTRREVHCSTCGDHHYEDSIPYICETGDGI